MTKKEARAALEALRQKWCKCGSESLKLIDHPAGCGYRTAALRANEARETIDLGDLYCVADPEPVAA